MSRAYKREARHKMQLYRCFPSGSNNSNVSLNTTNLIIIAHINKIPEELSFCPEASFINNSCLRSLSHKHQCIFEVIGCLVVEILY